MTSNSPLAACVVALTSFCFCIGPGTTGIATAQEAAPATPAAIAASSDTATPSLEALLAKPLSIGVIAALGTYATEASAQTRLADALKDSRSDVRAMAARVIYVNGLRGLLPALRLALQTEENRRVARELIPPIVQFGSPDAYQEARAAADRLKGAAFYGFADILSRLARPELVTDLPWLLATADSASAIAEPVMAATASVPADRAAALVQFAQRPAWLRSALVALEARREAAPVDLLTTWLQSEDEAIRTVTVWHLVSRQLLATSDSKRGNPRGKDAPPIPELAPLKSALDAVRAAHGQAETWESLGLEILARIDGVNRKPVRRRRQSLASQPKALPIRLRPEERAALTEYLDNTELDDLSEVWFADRGVMRKSLSAHKESAADDQGREPEVGLRTVPRDVRGLWTDLLAIYGCTPAPTPGELISAAVAYRADGRTRTMRLNPGGTPACRGAASVIFGLALYEKHLPAPATFVDTLVANLNPEVIACTDGIGEPEEREIPPTAERPAEVVDRGRIEPPKKTRHVSPVYPAKEQEAARQGVVLLEATVSTSGCVASVRRTRTVSPALDAAALLAVQQWRYSAARVDDVPVPLIVSVSVGFRLER